MGGKLNLLLILELLGIFEFWRLGLSNGRGRFRSLLQGRFGIWFCCAGGDGLRLWFGLLGWSAKSWINSKRVPVLLRRELGADRAVLWLGLRCLALFCSFLGLLGAVLIWNIQGDLSIFGWSLGRFLVYLRF